jgi:hypothetical protein
MKKENESLVKLLEHKEKEVVEINKVKEKEIQVLTKKI